MYPLKEIMEQVKKHNPGERELYQSIQEVFEDVIPFNGDSN